MSKKKQVVDQLKKKFSSLGKHGSSSSSSSIKRGDVSSSSSSSTTPGAGRRDGSSINRGAGEPERRDEAPVTTRTTITNRDADHTFWSRDLDRHYLGDYSYAVLKGNAVMEDYSEVVVSRKATFIGVYDGHCGHGTAKHLFDKFLENLMRQVKEDKTMSMNGLKHAFYKAESDWVAKLEKEFKDEELLAAMGASCLVGLIWRGNLYVANAGGCKALAGETTNILAMDDNMKHQDISVRLVTIRMGDKSKFGEKVDKTFLIKGRTEFSKSIGDAYLKYPQYNIDHHKGYELNEPLDPADEPVLSSEPFVNVIPIATFIEDRQYVIFASHGFWDIMKDEEAIAILKVYPRKGIAARLIREGLKKAARIKRKSHTEILNVKDENGGKRYHDDMTVIVIFFNRHLHETVIEEEVSVKVGESNLSALDDALQGADKALERTEPADLDQALKGADETLEGTEPADLDQALKGADETLEGTEPADLDQDWQVENVGR